MFFDKMGRILAFFVILQIVIIKSVIAEESDDFKLSDDEYEYDQRTNTRRLKHVKQVVDDHLAKDFPKINDCGPDEKQNWYEPDPEDCSCYFVCTGRYYVHRKCSPGLMFDPNSEICNWPEVVDCGGRPEPWSWPDYHGPAQHVHFNTLQE